MKRFSALSKYFNWWDFLCWATLNWIIYTTLVRKGWVSMSNYRKFFEECRFLNEKFCNFVEWIQMLRKNSNTNTNSRIYTTLVNTVWCAFHSLMIFYNIITFEEIMLFIEKFSNFLEWIQMLRIFLLITQIHWFTLL